MSYIHDQSEPAVKSELDLFVIPPTQTIIDQSFDTKLKHSSSLDSTRTIEFHIPAGEDYIDLSECYLNIRCQVTAADGTVLPSADTMKVTGANNLLFSMFQSLEVTLGGELISQATNSYAFKSFFDTLVYASLLSKETYLQSQWFRATKEKRKCASDFTIDLYGKLNGDIFSQSRLMLNEIPLALKFTRARDAFCLNVLAGSTTTEPLLKITEASLYIRKVKVTPDADAAIALALEKSTAKYFFTRSEVRSFNVSSGSASFSADNVYNGQLPKRFFIAFVTNKSFTGDYEDDSLTFAHNNVTQIVAFIDGKMVPSDPYAPNFPKKSYNREYLSLYKEFNQLHPWSALGITKDDYAAECCLFAFNLSPDKHEGSQCGHLSLLHRGNVRIEVTFKSPGPSSALTMLVYGQHDSLVEVDRQRNVNKDY